MSFLKRRNFSWLLLVMVVVLAGCFEEEQTVDQSTRLLGPSTLLYVATPSDIKAVRTVDGKIAQTYSLSPASLQFIVARGIIYMATPDAISAIDGNDGKQLWSIPNSAAPNAITVFQGKVFISLQGGLLYGLDSKTGALQWRQTIPLDQTDLRLLPGNGILYAWHDSEVVALDPQTGKQLWANKAETRTNYTIQHAFLANNTLVVIWEGFIRGLDSENGKQKWTIDSVTNEEFDTHGISVYQSLFANNTVYFGLSLKKDESGSESENMLTAHDPDTGKQKWKVDDDTVKNQEGVVLGPDGFFSIGGPSQGDLTARNLENGQQLWTKPGTGTYTSINEDNGILYALDKDQALEAYDARNGKLLWTYKGVDDFTVLDHTPYIVQASLQGSTLVSIDTKKGQSRWQCEPGTISNMYYFDQSAPADIPGRKGSPR